MENIGKFLTACPAYGVASEYLFQTPDLYEDKNMTGVCFAFSLSLSLLCILTPFILLSSILRTQVLVTLDNVRRIQGIKAKGGKVEAVQVRVNKHLFFILFFPFSQTHTHCLPKKKKNR